MSKFKTLYQAETKRALHVTLQFCILLSSTGLQIGDNNAIV